MFKVTVMSLIQNLWWDVGFKLVSIPLRLYGLCSIRVETRRSPHHRVILRSCEKIKYWLFCIRMLHSLTFIQIMLLSSWSKNEWWKQQTTAKICQSTSESLIECVNHLLIRRAADFWHRFRGAIHIRYISSRCLRLLLSVRLEQFDMDIIGLTMHFRRSHLSLRCASSRSR